MPIKPKIPIRERIPDEFVEFMREVAALIEQGDEAAWTESDDLLQCDCAYGGLNDTANGRYGFCYIIPGREEEEREACWAYDLGRQQVRDIAAGNVTEIDMWRCEPRDCGRRFPCVDYYCVECDFPLD